MEENQLIDVEIIDGFMKAKPIEKTAWFMRYHAEVLPGRALDLIAKDYLRMEYELKCEVVMSEEENAQALSAQVHVLRYLKKNFDQNALKRFARKLQRHDQEWNERSWLDQMILNRQEAEEEKKRQIQKQAKEKPSGNNRVVNMKREPGQKEQQPPASNVATG